MQRLLYFALPALFLSPAATGQQLRFGVKAGVNYAKGYTPNVVGYNRLLGFNGGVVARYQLSPDGFWNIQPELLFSAKGDKNKYAGSLPNTRLTRHYRRNYLDLPILAKVNARGLTFETGPQLSYLLSVSGRDNFLNGNQLEGYNRFQAGYAVGVGYELPAGLSLTVRYGADLTSIYKAPQGLGYHDTTRNSVFQAQLGYLLGARQ